MGPENMHEKIEDYLSGQMEGEALRQFEKEMQENAVLAEEVALYRDMAGALRPSREEALRENLALLDKKYATQQAGKKGAGRWWIILMVLLAMAVGWWLKKIATDTPNTPATEDQTPREPENNLPDTPAQKNSGDLILPGTPEQKQTPPVAQDQSSSKKEDDTALLAANFEPNPQLEALMDSQVRGEAYRFRVREPLLNARLRLQNGQTTLVASGVLETAAAEVITPFRALLFSNKKEDYRNFKPAFSQNLLFDKSGEGFRFALNTRLSLSPGLYYFLIEDEDSGTLYYITKVRVQ